MNGMTNDRLFELFERYQEGTASEAEADELMYLLKDVSDDELSAVLLKAWNKQQGSRLIFTSGLREKVIRRKFFTTPFRRPEAVRSNWN